MEEYETGWQSDIITDELGIVYLHNHFHGDCAKVHGCQMAIAGFLESYVFSPSGFWIMAPLRYAAKFDPFLSLDCARVEAVWGRNPRKGRDQILQRSVAEP